MRREGAYVSTNAPSMPHRAPHSPKFFSDDFRYQHFQAVLFPPKARPTVDRVDHLVPEDHRVETARRGGMDLKAAARTPGEIPNPWRPRFVDARLEAVLR